MHSRQPTLVVTVLLATADAVSASCTQINILDGAEGDGTCDGYISSQVLSCSTDLASGGAYDNYCDLSCFPNALENPVEWGVSSALQVQWLEAWPEMVADLAIATGADMGALDASTAASLLAPGICQLLIDANPDKNYCVTTLNAGAPNNGASLPVLNQNWGLCDGTCPCQCSDTECGPPPPPT